MAIFKCKMCGGTLEIQPGESVAVCDSCGSRQTIPNLSDDRRANLYDRANHFRRANEFDKAMGIYEQILNEDNSDAEAHWSLVLCRYGIEYVEDPASHRMVPTVNRAQFTSIFSDEDYKAALANADGYQRDVYEQEAKEIDDIQKGILAISQKEEPFDVFISFKETDANGRRTPDSVLANELYHQLTREGFKVFFAPITLEDKLGTEYEPYIFAALNSSKVMVVLGTKPEHFNAVWVKNEWSRFLALMKKGANKTLIPAYKDMDPYDLPDEFSHLMAQDMSKLGFMQDLIRGIKKLCGAEASAASKQSYTPAPAVSSTAPLLKRAFMFLEDGDWQKADDFCEQVLNQDPENAEAYLGKLMAELRVHSRSELKDVDLPFNNRSNYEKVLRFGSVELKNELQGAVEHIINRNEQQRLKNLYDNANGLKKRAATEEEFKLAAAEFNKIREYKDAEALAKECNALADKARKTAVIEAAKAEMSKNTVAGYEAASGILKQISAYSESTELTAECQREIEKLKLEAARRAEEKRIAAEKAKAKAKKIFTIAASAAAIFIVIFLLVTKVIIPNSNYNSAVALMESGEYEEAILAFKAMDGYKDSANQIELCNTAIKDEAYAQALSLYNAEEYEKAIAAFEALGDYKDSAEMITETHYMQATALLESGNYTEAYSKYKSISGYKDVDTLLETDENLLAAAAARRAEWTTIGNIVTFGSYEQDNNTSNGQEDIEWIVLATEGDKSLIISKYALDCQQYNTKYTSVTWETCSLRTWLNETFYNSAFSTAEQAQILKTTVTADKNPSYSTSPGNDTKDNVFLLSITEANKYFSSDSERMCVPTAYAIAQGAYTSSSYSVGGKATCWWWLRSPGGNGSGAANVLYDGSVDTYGHNISIGGYCVRPALWINLES